MRHDLTSSTKCQKKNGTSRAYLGIRYPTDGLGVLIAYQTAEKIRVRKYVTKKMDKCRWKG